MDQQKRQILFVILSMAILLGWLWLMPPAPPPKAAATASTPVPGKPATLSSAPTTSAAPSGSAPKRTLPRTSQVPARAVTLETDDYKAVLSSRGAVLTSFTLKRYFQRPSKKPVELVEEGIDPVLPFSLSYDPLPGINNAVFETEGFSQKLGKKGDKARVAFRYVDPKGTVLEKVFTFQEGSYSIGFDLQVRQTGRETLPASELALEWPSSLGRPENTGTRVAMGGGYHVSFMVGEDVEKESPKKSQEPRGPVPNVRWVALADQFFLAALIPDPSTGGASAMVLRDQHAHKVPTQEDPEPGMDPKVFTPRPVLHFAGQALRNGESFSRKGEVFLGPQDYSLLKRMGFGLERVVDFGKFVGFISVYMLALLKWFFSWTHNWGLAIILLSLMVKLLLWFPTHNSYKHMSQMGTKMKEIQPKLEAIKKKYANDRQKQQQETMLIYQQAGINPMGGCLPLFLQTPVFIALYSTLMHSIELRGASFLWLHDLSLKDPIFVLPLLMGGTMLLQQRVSGQMSTQVAGQQKFMMWFLPIFLTFMSFQWASGLLVYWVVTNLLSMVQQRVVNREIAQSRKKEEVSAK